MFNKYHRLSILRFGMVLVLVAGMLGAAPVGSVLASTFTVTTTSDSGPGSLRQAITAAASGDTIRFDPTLAGQTITLASHLFIIRSITIDGSGLSPQVTISGGNVAHIDIDSPLNSTVTISDVTIADGYNSGNGGAIFSPMINLNIINSTLRNNHAAGAGGAIFSYGSLKLKNTTVYQNQAGSLGGAFAFRANASGIDIINSTVVQNQAGSNGGAIYMDGAAEAAIYNSTFAGNSAPQRGSELELLGSTALYLANTVFVCTPGNSDCYYHTPVTATITYEADSILGVGTLSDYGLLSELDDHGGPTKTMALLATSPLIDAGNDSFCWGPLVDHLDQRGVTRPQGLHCDIGAYEYESGGTAFPTTPTLTVTDSSIPVGGTGPGVTQPGDPFTIAATVNGSAGPAAGTVTFSFNGVAVCINVALVNGTADCPMALPYPGGPITVDYTPTDPTVYNATSTTIAHTVGPAETITTVVDIPHQSLPGSPVTIAVIVTSAGSTPTGTVDITTDVGNCTITLVNGQGSCPNPFVFNVLGTSTISAVYTPGDFEHKPSSGTTAHEVVTPPPVSGCNYIRDNTGAISISGTTMSLTLNNTGNNYPVTVSSVFVAWNYDKGHATGDTRLWLQKADANGTQFWSGNLNQPNALLPLSTAVTVPANGTLQIAFTFDKTYDGPRGLEQVQVQFSTPGCEEYPVIRPVDTPTPAETITTIVDTPDPSLAGSNVTISVVVSNKFGGTTPTGTVEVTTTAGNCTITLVNGQGNCSLVFNALGVSAINAVYTPGDLEHQSSSGTTAHEVVTPPPVSGCNYIRDNTGAITISGKTMYLDLKNTGNNYPVTVSSVFVAWNYDKGHATGQTSLYLQKADANGTVFWTGNLNQPSAVLPLSRTVTVPANGTLRIAFTFDKIYDGPRGSELVQVQFSTPGCQDYPVVRPAGMPTIIPGAGTYDDRDANWTFSNGWTNYDGAGPYSGTSLYTNVAGSQAQFVFNGNKFTFTYVKASNRGLIDVFVDGIKIAQINAKSSTTAWGQIWTSPKLTSGIHTVRFVHAGASGTYIDVDAIQIFAASEFVVPAAVSDLEASTGTTTGSVDLSWTAPGDDGSTGTATSYLVRYSTSAITSGNWNDATPITTGVPIPQASGQPESMTVSSLTPGATYFFAVRAQDEEENLGEVSNSPSAAAQSPNHVPAGTYDDTDINWVYTGSWTQYNGGGPANNTSHYTSTVGSAAQITFDGVKFTFTYVKAANRGLIDVYVDGGKIAQINAKSTSTTWQASWTSPALTAGVHTVRFVHAGGGTYIDVDKIQIIAPPTPVPAGPYDDNHAAWTFSSGWTMHSGAGPLNNTDHYTNVVGSDAQLTFTGTGFTFTYVKAANRGLIDVYVDGVKVIQLNARNSSTLWQQTWTRSGLSSGTHTVRFVNAGGGYIDVDSITILP